MRVNRVILPPSVAGWSSLAARRAHNPKVVGSNPAPATNFNNKNNKLSAKTAIIPTARTADFSILWALPSRLGAGSL
jgi:hypothetical protein